MRNIIRILLVVAIGGILAGPAAAQDLLGPSEPLPYEPVEAG